MPPTCFGHSCDHPQGGALQRIDQYRYFTKVCEQMHTCKILGKLLLYFYVHWLVSLLCRVDPLHGYGLFKFKRKNLYMLFWWKCKFAWLCRTGNVCEYVDNLSAKTWKSAYSRNMTVCFLIAIRRAENLNMWKSRPSISLHVSFSSKFYSCLASAECHWAKDSLRKWTLIHMSCKSKLWFLKKVVVTTVIIMAQSFTNFCFCLKKYVESILSDNSYLSSLRMFSRSPLCLFSLRHGPRCLAQYILVNIGF